MTRAHSSGRRLFSSLSLLLKNLWKTKELEWKTSSQEVLKDLFFDDGPKGIPQNFEEGQRRRRCTNFLMFFFLLALVLLSFFYTTITKGSWEPNVGTQQKLGKNIWFLLLVSADPGLGLRWEITWLLDSSWLFKVSFSPFIPSPTFFSRKTSAPALLSVVSNWESLFGSVASIFAFSGQI